VRVFGLYGAEELAGDGSIIHRGPGRDHRAAFEEVIAAAREQAPRARIEDKGDSVALHWRESPADEALLRAVAAHAARAYGLVLRPGRMVVELGAPGAPDKGSVARLLLAGAAAAVAFGDDVGDLATFAALDEARVTASTTIVKIAVGGVEMPPPLVESADLVLSDPSTAAAVLASVADGLDAAS
jgi:trehalose 6-phosphate phosphatase